MEQDETNAETQTTVNRIDQDTGRPIKRCFITVGATASFTSLIRNALAITFLETLREHHYTHLLIQYGKDGQKVFEDYAWVLSDDSKQRLDVDISGFDFRKDGLKDEMLAAKRGLTVRSDRPTEKRNKDGKDVDIQDVKEGVEGCVISHAGSGSILDALRLEVPLIVVPNPDLLDNHQLELAEVLAEQNYVVHGNLSNLGESIAAVEQLRQRRQAWPPVVGSDQKTPKQTLATILDDELGWID